jgi:hypothetical protein
MRLDVRRIAAVDMWGGRGTRRRRAIIVAEFVLGATVGPVLGLLLAITGSALGWRVLGAWVAGACLNYIPLALHAISLFPGRRLEAELSGVDVRGELRYYTVAQLWIAVPLLFVALDLVQRRRRAA